MEDESAKVKHIDHVRGEVEGVTETQMIEACKACGIHNFISALPHGYDSVLSDNAVCRERSVFTRA